ncbi:MAG: GNAT family N-acetyltransferase [Candidatus Dormibacteria bacterium]
MAIELFPLVDVPEVVALYRSVGWTAYADAPSVLDAALRGSSRVVTPRRRGTLVGLARVISDGAMICYIQDVLVHPDARRIGIGRDRVEAVLRPYAHVRQKVLLSDRDPGQRGFYESLGFSETRNYAAGTLRAFVRFDI